VSSRELEALRDNVQSTVKDMVQTLEHRIQRSEDLRQATPPVRVRLRLPGCRRCC
jgi:hypothetical protein